MEEEFIDLRVYLDIVLKWWKEIAGFALLCAVVAGLVSVYVLKPSYEADAVIAISKTLSSVSLDSRLQTLSDDDLALTGGRTFLDPVARRNALVALVRSPTVAEAVIAELGDTWLENGEQNPTRLVGKIKGETSNGSDLILITAHDGNPAKAAALATAWARAYVVYVNQLYAKGAETYDAVQIQAGEAQVGYQTAQTALETFIAENRAAEIERLIAEKQAILDRLQADKRAALTTLFDPTWEEDILASSVSGLLSSQIFTLKRPVDMPEEDTIPQLAAPLAERLQALSDAYQLRQRYESQLFDVKDMREHLVEGGDPATNALAIMLLKTQIFDTVGGAPANIQLQFDTLAVQTAEAQLADLDALTAALEANIARLTEQIASETKTWLDAMDYGFAVVAVDDPADPINGVLEQLQVEVQQLQSELEAQQARERELIAARDLAWESYNTLLRREAEVRIDREAPDSEVRFAAPAAVPLSPVSPRKTMNVAVAGAAGFVLSVLLAFLMDYLGQPPLLSRLFSKKAADA